MGIKKELFKLFILLPAIFGYLGIPLIVILRQFGIYNLDNSLLSKGCIVWMGIAMYISYFFIIRKLRKVKGGIENGF